jgi:hypothetical protein
MPKITIGIPALNTRFLQKAMRSALAQTLGDFELLVSDDSVDGSVRELADGFQDGRIRCIEGPRNGFAANITHVWENAGGEFLKFLHDDDYLFPTALEEMLQILERDPRHVLAFSRRLFVDEDDNVLARAKVFAGDNWLWFERPGITQYLLRDLFNQIAEPASILIRREALPGPSCLTSYAGVPIRRLIDVALLMNADLAGRTVGLPHYFVALRQHDGRFSAQQGLGSGSEAHFEWEIFLRGAIQKGLLTPAVALPVVARLNEIYRFHAAEFPELAALVRGLADLHAWLLAGEVNVVTGDFIANIKAAHAQIDHRTESGGASAGVGLEARQHLPGRFWDRFHGGKYSRNFDPAWVDAEWYFQTYRKTEPALRTSADSLKHFQDVGMVKGYDPSPEFSSEFYMLYYPDVRRRVQEGELPSAFYHFVFAGREEGRLPRHNLAHALKQKLQSATDPVAFRKAQALEERLKPPSCVVHADEPRRVNVFIPSTDPDIFFGGYIAFLHFLCRLAEQGVRLRLLVMEDKYASKEWLLEGIANKPRWRTAFQGVEVVNCRDLTRPVVLSPADLCVAYSAWMLHDASHVCAKLEQKRPIYFAQEYEPIFHEHDGYRFIVEGAYRRPHTAIFNTTILRDYFEARGLGVFGLPGGAPHVTFQHALADVAPPSVDELRRRTSRKLIFYARPERHAARNLCDIGILALKSAVKQGLFDDRWSFHGVGTMGTAHRIDIGHRAPLEITSRIPQEEYERTLQSFDVGLSLMWAPHPSVLPFELARAGVVTVTNTFESRDSLALSRVTANIVPAEPSIEDIAAALGRAAQLAERYPERAGGARFDWPSNWDQVFDADFFDRLAKAHGEDLRRIR